MGREAREAAALVASGGSMEFDVSREELEELIDYFVLQRAVNHGEFFDAGRDSEFWKRCLDIAERGDARFVGLRIKLTA